jgi:hypothetical protein
MKANRLYRDIMKRLSAVPMHNRTREGAQVELRRAISMIEFLLGKRKVETGARQA